MLRFENNDVVLPITVIEELDRFKKQPEVTGRNARQISRSLDVLRQQGHLTDGIVLKSEGMLRVALCHREALQQLPPDLEGGYPSGGSASPRADNSILALALELKRQCGRSYI